MIEKIFLKYWFSLRYIATECKPGEFLNIVSQTCEQCNEGEFSVGDGKRFANWNKLPINGFKSRGFSEVSVFETTHKKGKDDPCFRYYDNFHSIL